jgi:formylglycine-generating enzyme required for sulfatase activity
VPDALVAPLAALTDERQRLRSRAELALQQEQQRAHDLRRRLDAATVPGAERPPAPFTARLAAAGVALALIGGALGFGAGRSTAPEVAPTPPVTPVTVAPTAIPTAPLVPPTDDAPDASARVARPLSCPRGMVHVGPATEADSFCIDAAPVKEGEFRRCVTAGRCARPPAVRVAGSNWNLGAAGDDYAANFLPWEMARAYCQQRDPGSGLPTRLEWRAAATHRAPVRLVPDTREWSDDGAGDGTRQVRGDARGTTDYAWSSLPASAGYRDVSFRCVLRAVPPG